MIEPMASTQSPSVIVLGGPNGAGKSTSAPFVLRDTARVHEFVNADIIAQGLSGYSPSTSAIKAGRLMLAKLRDLAASRVDLAFETTLATRGFAPWLTSLQASGYCFHLVFFWLPSPEVALARVKMRVQNGGHNIPDDVVRRRYYRGLTNFCRLYAPLADSWTVFDNSGVGPPEVVARKPVADKLEIVDKAAWSHIQSHD